MNKLKTVLVLLLTVLLIVILALLPQAMAGVSDFMGNKKPGTVSMQSVELAFDSDKADEPGYMMRKLALEQRMTTIPIDPVQASMTEGEVITAAKTGMDIYMEASMFDWFDITYQMAEPYLGVDPNDRNNNTIFWGVTFTAEDGPYHHLFMHIDDETGKVLFINYETYGEDKFNYDRPENQRRMMEGFVHSFFSPLNLTQLSEYENLLETSMLEQYVSDDVTCVRYTFEDAQYGTIHVEFYITPMGFCVYFPSE